MPDTLKIHHENGIATVTLRRPEARNAFDGAMIRALTSAFQEIAADEGTRVVVLTAEGTTFCAGADLNWMRAAVDHDYETNVAEALELAKMLRAIAGCPKPVIGRIPGAAYGGGVGLVAACDMAVAVEAAVFCFSEVKLGLVPAVIAPFVFRKMDPGHARRYFLTAETFPAPEARRLGLIEEVAPSVEALDEIVTGWARRLQSNGPEALAAGKQLIEELAGPISDATLTDCARRIAERRASPEGQEGMRAFLEKRRPKWSAE